MTQQSFSNYVGIDVSKNKLDVFILPEKKHFTVDNSEEGMNELIKKLPKDSGILLEATGGFERLVANTLDEKKFKVCVINPKLIFHFRKSINHLPKTDKIDSAVLARFASERSDLRYDLYNRTQQKLLGLQRCREQLKKTLKQEKNRLSLTHTEESKDAHEIVIKTICEQITALEIEIQKIIDTSDEYLAQQELLCSIPGIAESLSMTLIASLPEMGKIKHKALQRLVGVAPICNDSGTFQGKRFIQGGRQAVRDALYMAALVSIQYNPAIKAYYMRKVSEGKPKKSALMACIAKIVRIINSVIRSGQPYVLPEIAA